MFLHRFGKAFPHWVDAARPTHLVSLSVISVEPSLAYIDNNSFPCYIEYKKIQGRC